jgi:hypothetical protein
MTHDAEVRHRDKRVSRLLAGVLVAPALFTWFMAFFIAFTNSSADKPLPGAALPIVVAAMGGLGLMFVVLSLTFAVLRSVVTDHQVVVKYGLWGPEIDLASIVSCKVVDYEWTKFGGFGIRLGSGGVWAYVPGPGEVVEIEYDASGERKKVLVGAKDARALSLEINRAREALVRARIAGDARDEAMEREVETMAAALEAEEAEKEAIEPRQVR